jgi:arabinogalactan oligomer/maltooligosaccharide transport system substrate-binding protein
LGIYRRTDEWIKAAGEAFTKLNPNITVEFVNVELETPLANCFRRTAGVGPNLFAAPHDKLGELVIGGHILRR